MGVGKISSIRKEFSYFPFTMERERKTWEQVVSGGVEGAQKMEGLHRIGGGRDGVGYQGRLHQGAHGRAEALRARRVSPAN